MLEGQWTAYATFPHNLRMYVHESCKRRFPSEYYPYEGKPLYRINVRLKPKTIWYGSKGEHIGGRPYLEYIDGDALWVNEQHQTSLTSNNDIV